MTTLLRKPKFGLWCFVALCTVSACDCDDDSSLPPDQVYVHIKRGVDFSDYKTFHIDDDLTQDDLADAGVNVDDFPEDVRLNIETANDQARIELEKVGLDEVENQDEADLVVASMGSTKTEDAIYWECVPGYWWGYWGWYWDSCAWLDPEYVKWTVGSMVLGLADPTMKDIVFGGLLTGVADGGGDVEQRIRAGVHEMFEKYPETGSKRDE